MVGPPSSRNHGDFESEALLAAPSVYIYRAVLSRVGLSSIYDALELSLAVTAGEGKAPNRPSGPDIALPEDCAEAER